MIFCQLYLWLANSYFASHTLTISTYIKDDGTCLCELLREAIVPACWRQFKRDPLSPVWGGPLRPEASSEHTRALTVA
jgi:hypothetical protein